MDLKDRIRSVRNESGLTQSEFGEKIGVKGNTMANYEIGLRTPKEATLLSISREFGVNLEWLRDGTGEMREALTKEQEFTRTAARIVKSHDELIMNMVIEYWKLDPESRKLLINFIQKIAQKKE